MTSNLCIRPKPRTAIRSSNVFKICLVKILVFIDYFNRFFSYIHIFAKRNWKVYIKHVIILVVLQECSLQEPMTQEDVLLDDTDNSTKSK